MKLVLTITGPDGEVTELPVDDARLEIITQPGHRYQLLPDEAATLPTDGTKVTSPLAGLISPRALRLDDDLMLDQLPDGYPVLLRGFFANCTADNPCELTINVPGAANATITPMNEPLAAYAEGGFLMYTGSQTTTAALPTPPEAESNFNWRPIAALGGALAIAAGAGGGGGSTVASDSTGTGTPQITGGTLTNSATPVFTGTADPGSSVRLSLQISGPSGTTTVGYSTQADRSGNWTISTLTDTPASGQFPASGLQADQSARVSVVATNAAGSISTVVNDEVILDTVAPARPTVNTDGDLSASTGASLNGVPVINAVEAADGIVIDGAAEAGSTVNITLTGPNGYSLTDQAVADASGRFALTIAAAQAPAEDGDLSLTISATDLAGNTSPELQTPIVLDLTLSDAAVAITSIVDDRAPAVGTVSGSSNDTTPTINGSLVGALASDERIELLRNGDLIGAAQIDGDTWSFTDNLNAAPDGPEGNYEYMAQVADEAGNLGNGGAIGLQSATVAVTIDTTPPAQVVRITSVIDNDGPSPVSVDPGSVTDDLTPAIQISLTDVLQAGESLQLIRSRNGEITLVGEEVDADGSGELTFEFQDSFVGGGSGVVYQAQVVDAAGLAGLPSTTYTIRLLDPLDNLP